MNKKRLSLYVLMALIFLVNLAGASWIAVTGSDRAPFEQTYPGQCAYPIVSVVYDDPTKPNPKVIEVDLTGDFSECVGSQVLVTTYKTGHVHSYAVAEILENQGVIELSFEKHGGDFYQKFPLVVNHRLVSDGPTAPSSNSIDPAEIQVVFAWTWN
jgi:hypothetical protein